jgi:NAD(P)-dependent dehydrogenase (short-subunit alcohol dehydrogenase family)
MAANPVVLILGARLRIGASVADKFASKSYLVVVAFRRGIGTTAANGLLSLRVSPNPSQRHLKQSRPSSTLLPAEKKKKITITFFP